MIPLQTPTDTSATSNAKADLTLTVYFFRTRTFFGWLVRLLQWVLGASFSSPNHVAIGYKGKLIQLTTDGIEVAEDTGAAYKLCDDIRHITISPFQQTYLEAIIVGFSDLNVYFSLKRAILFSVRALWFTLVSKRELSFDQGLNYGEFMIIESGRLAFFSPPISCTTFVWQALEDDMLFDWRVFSAPFLLEAIDNH